jgi:hypothetical protein
MAKFLLLTRRGPFPRDMSPEEMQRIVGRFRSWTEGVRQAGKLLDGAGLLSEGRVVRQAAGKLAVTDGPYAESKEVLGGYWLIEAASYDEVIAMAQDNPGLQFGSLEIRQLM